MESDMRQFACLRWIRWLIDGDEAAARGAAQFAGITKRCLRHPPSHDTPTIHLSRGPWARPNVPRPKTGDL